MRNTNTFIKTKNMLPYAQYSGFKTLKRKFMQEQLKLQSVRVSAIQFSNYLYIFGL